MKQVYTLLFLLSFNAFCLGQSIDLEGTITDAGGTPIMGANIVAVEKETKILDGFGISNELGYYRLTLKKQTDYEVKISFIGLKEVSFVFNESDFIGKPFFSKYSSISVFFLLLIFNLSSIISSMNFILASK